MFVPRVCARSQTALDGFASVENGTPQTTTKKMQTMTNNKKILSSCDVCVTCIQASLTASSVRVAVPRPVRRAAKQRHMYSERHMESGSSQ